MLLVVITESVATAIDEPTFNLKVMAMACQIICKKLSSGPSLKNNYSNLKLLNQKNIQVPLKL